MQVSEGLTETGAHKGRLGPILTPLKNGGPIALL